MTWLSTAQAAERIGRPTKYVREAAETGELHGHQRTRGGKPLPKSRWTFAPDAVDAFVQGFDPHAQSRACGCAALRAVRRAG